MMEVVETGSLLLLPTAVAAVAGKTPAEEAAAEAEEAEEATSFLILQSASQVFSWFPTCPPTERQDLPLLALVLSGLLWKGRCEVDSLEAFGRVPPSIPQRPTRCYIRARQQGGVRADAPH